MTHDDRFIVEPIATATREIMRSSRLVWLSLFAPGLLAAPFAPTEHSRCFIHPEMFCERRMFNAPTRPTLWGVP